jgi:hypothetical protein
MGGNDGHRLPVVFGQLPQTVQVTDPAGGIVLERHLKGRQEGRTVKQVAMHLVSVEIGVAGMKQPSVPLAHGDAAMATGVARQRNEQDVVTDTFEGSHGWEAEPLFPLFLIDGPARLVGPLVAMVAALFHDSPGPDDGSVLVGENVDDGIWKVGQAPGMIDVQMGRNDVPDILALESQPLQLSHSRLLGIEDRPDHMTKGGVQTFGWVRDVFQSQAGIDEHDAIIRLDGETMADHASRG